MSDLCSLQPLTEDDVYVSYVRTAFEGLHKNASTLHKLAQDKRWNKDWQFLVITGKNKLTSDTECEETECGSGRVWEQHKKHHTATASDTDSKPVVVRGEIVPEDEREKSPHAAAVSEQATFKPQLESVRSLQEDDGNFIDLDQALHGNSHPNSHANSPLPPVTSALSARVLEIVPLDTSPTSYHPDTLNSSSNHLNAFGSSSDQNNAFGSLSDHTNNFRSSSDHQNPLGAFSMHEGPVVANSTDDDNTITVLPAPVVEINRADWDEPGHNVAIGIYKQPPNSSRRSNSCVEKSKRRQDTLPNLAELKTEPLHSYTQYAATDIKEEDYDEEQVQDKEDKDYSEEEQQEEITTEDNDSESDEEYVPSSRNHQGGPKRKRRKLNPMSPNKGQQFKKTIVRTSAQKPETEINIKAAVMAAVSGISRNTVHIHGPGGNGSGALNTPGQVRQATAMNYAAPEAASQGMATGMRKINGLGIKPKITLRSMQLEHMIAYTCEVCGQQFMKQSFLQKHYELQHPRSAYKPLPASKPKTSHKTSRDELTAAYIAASIQTPNKYKCGVCGDGFGTAPQLVAHNRTHLQEPKKPPKMKKREPKMPDRKMKPVVVLERLKIGKSLFH